MVWVNSLAMGYYTTFDLKFPLKKETPSEIIELLEKLSNHTFWNEPGMYQVNERPDLPIEHEFGRTTRWPQIFSSTKFENFTLKIKGELKNYDSEIQKLVDWLNPYIKGRKQKIYLGWSKGEERSDPQIHYYKYNESNT